MRKLLLLILTISASLVYNNAGAQGCGTTNNYIPLPNIPTGFENSDSIPCAVQGVPYNDTVTFKMYNTFDYIGHHGIDSITLDTVFNLPCGLCWSFNKANRTYAADETGSMIISGTTNDVVGQYNLRLIIKAYLTDAGATLVTPNTVDDAGIRVWLRVAAAAGSCAPVDTNRATNTNQIAATSCPVGINEVVANVASISIMPSPMNSNATLSFTAVNSASYTLKVTDITGQVISVKQIQANPGVNTSVIDRGNLSSGIYFLSLTDGVSTVTRKFTVAD